MSDEDNGNGNDPGNETVTMTRAEFDAHNAKLRRAIQQRTDRRAADDGPGSKNARIAGLEGAMAQQTQILQALAERLAPSTTYREPVVAPRAPAGAVERDVREKSVMELSSDEIDRLGPRGLRGMLEKEMNRHNDTIGRPTPPRPGDGGVGGGRHNNGRPR